MVWLVRLLNLTARIVQQIHCHLGRRPTAVLGLGGAGLRTVGAH
jgi:hypothetical protein